MKPVLSPDEKHVFDALKPMLAPIGEEQEDFADTTPANQEYFIELLAIFGLFSLALYIWNLDFKFEFMSDFFSSFISYIHLILNSKFEIKHLNFELNCDAYPWLLKIEI